MPRKYLKTLLGAILTFVVGSLLFPQYIWAVSNSPIIQNLKATKDASDLPAYDSPIPVVILVIKGALGIVAVLFFVMILIAGFKWMTAGGNTETIDKAKKNITSAVIGLIIIMFAYVITFFVLNMILNPTGS